MDKKVALVTGGSRGIGAAISLLLAENGYHVIINYKENEKAANVVKNTIESKNGSAFIVQADVSDEDAVKKMMEAVIEKYGAIDCLINNAGVIHHTPITFLGKNDWDTVVKVALDGSFLCTKYVVRSMMKSRWGRIINIASDAGRAGETMAAHYSAAKAGILGLTKSNARELARYNITVNAISPGFISTEMTEGTNESTIKKQIENVPLKRFGTTDEVAHLALYLLSQPAGYITGQVISINGGLTMN
jgi:3-oxoacyl-[acyl-carrier protein] reductase